MQFTVVGGLECNRADGALVQDLTVFFFDMSLLSLKGPENHITVKTSGRKGKHNCCNSALYTVGFLKKKNPAFLAKLLTCTKPCEHSAGSFP